MPRKASHRVDNRLGPENRWRQRQAEILAKVFRPISVGRKLVAEAVPVGRGVYQIPSGLMLDFRVAVDDAAPFLLREDWQ
jgi:hypothetical protein